MMATTRKCSTKISEYKKKKTKVRSDKKLGFVSRSGLVVKR